LCHRAIDTEKITGIGIIAAELICTLALVAAGKVVAELGRFTPATLLVGC
jgi:hypothetical protein